MRMVEDTLPGRITEKTSKAELRARDTRLLSTQPRPRSLQDGIGNGIPVRSLPPIAATFKTRRVVINTGPHFLTQVLGFLTSQPTP